MKKNLLLIGILTALSFGCEESVDLEFRVTASGFEEVSSETLKVRCESEGLAYEGSLSSSPSQQGDGNLVAAVKVPKDSVIHCTLVGSPFVGLPFIPVQTESHMGRYFRVSRSVQIPVKVQRKVFKLSRDVYSHAVFLPTDRIPGHAIEVAGAGRLAMRQVSSQ